jgi:HK97 family phage prohead protease
MTTEQRVFYRAVPATIANTEGVLSGRLVPYDVVADVVDFVDGKPDIYREGFRRGAFDGQLANGQRNKGVFTRIGLIHRHEGGLGYLGPFTSLREGDDGLYGNIKVVPTKAQDVAALLSEGIDELSIEFRLRSGTGIENTVTDAQGVRWRTCVHLDQVALEPNGAYSSAQVLAYRQEVDELVAAGAAQDDEAQREADALAAVQASAAEAEARKRSWDEMMERLPTEMERQQELVKTYGVTVPSGHAVDRSGELRPFGRDSTGSTR